MNINERIFAHYNKESTHTRTIGIYGATDVKKIKSGELIPETFFESTKQMVDGKGIGNIFTGCAYEAELIKILFEDKVKCKPHLKKDLKIAKGCYIRCNLDISFAKGIAECKAPTIFRDSIPEGYKDQMELYYRCGKKPVYCYMFVPRTDVEYKQKLIEEIKYEPSELRWKNIKKAVIQFDKDVIALYPNKNIKKKPCSKKLTTIK